MEIIKTTTDYEGIIYDGFDINIIDDDKEMIISQQGSDQHVDFRYNDLRDIEFPVSINIYPDIGEFYNLTEQLCENVRTGNIFWMKPNSTIAKEHAIDALNNPMYQQVCHDNVIEFRDDESIEWAADILRIIKSDGYYTYEFDRMPQKYTISNKDPFNASICIKYTGSKQTPFHIPFFWFYKHLQDIEEVRNKPKTRKRVNNC